jgi:hypothetical protein
MLHTLPRGGPVCYFFPLIACTLLLPSITKDEREQARMLLKRWWGVE